MWVYVQSIRAVILVCGQHAHVGVCLPVHLCADCEDPGQQSPPAAVWAWGREQWLLSPSLDAQVLPLSPGLQEWIFLHCYMARCGLTFMWVLKDE